MKYTILSAFVKEDLLFTVVEYEFPDGSKKEVTVPHFEPQTVADVALGLSNRAVSENRKVTSEETIKQVISELEIGVQVDLGK